MKPSTWAILLVAVVIVGALVLSTPKTPAAVTSPQASNASFWNSAGGFIGGLIAAGTKPSPPSSALPVYTPGVGYTQGGANAPIDPNTGGVILPEGEVYGPKL